MDYVADLDTHKTSGTAEAICIGGPHDGREARFHFSICPETKRWRAYVGGAKEFYTYQTLATAPLWVWRGPINTQELVNMLVDFYSQ